MGMRQRQAIVLALLCLGLTALAYGASINLPFFFDDLDHMPYVAGTTLPEIWTSAGGFPYFRPLGATVWRLSYGLLGENVAGVLHGINLGLHAFNGWLLGRLVMRFDREIEWLPWAAAGIYLLFPFSYQAIPWVGALYHILVITLALGAVLAGLKHVETKNPIWLAIGLFALFWPHSAMRTELRPHHWRLWSFF